MHRFHKQADGRAHHVAVALCRLLREMQREAGMEVEPASAVQQAWEVMRFGAETSALCAVRKDDFAGLDYGTRLAAIPEVVNTIDGANWNTLLELLGLLKQFHVITGVTISARILFERDECVLEAALPYLDVPAPVERFALQACMGLVCMTLLRCGMTAQALRGVEGPDLEQPRHCRICFSVSALQQPGVRQPAPSPHAFRQLLPSVLMRSPLSFQVEHALSNSDTLPDAEDICRRLNISRGTLHRGLKAGGTHFLQLLENEKLQRATYWLSVEQVTIEEVAARLGYSDASNFRRAFKKWTGHCPSDLRDRPGRPHTISIGARTRAGS